MDGRSGSARRLGGLAAAPGQDAGEGEMCSLECSQPPDLQRRGWMGQSVDQLPRALVPLPALTDAAIDDLLQVIGAAQAPDLAGANPGRRGSLHEHSQELPDLIDVVARLPLGSGGREDVARGSPRVQRPRVDAAPIALVPHDAEVPELQAHAVADEDVHRSQVAVEQLTAMELSEDLENPGDLAPRGPLGPPLPGALEIRAQVAVLRVLERETVEDAAVLSRQGKRVEDADRSGVPRQKLPEVGLAEPAVHLLARLDRDDGRDRQGARHPLRKVGLAETSLAEQAVDPIIEPGFGARDDLLGEEQGLPSPGARGRGHREGGGS